MVRSPVGVWLLRSAPQTDHRFLVDIREYVCGPQSRRRLVILHKSSEPEVAKLTSGLKSRQCNLRTENKRNWSPESVERSILGQWSVACEDKMSFEMEMTDQFEGNYEIRPGEYAVGWTIMKSA